MAMIGRCPQQTFDVRAVLMRSIGFARFDSYGLPKCFGVAATQMVMFEHDARRGSTVSTGCIDQFWSAVVIGLYPCDARGFSKHAGSKEDVSTFGLPDGTPFLNKINPTTHHAPVALPRYHRKHD
ncbi:hypothetical protein [Corynebacterium sp.]|uniref:hypothetical protein n=1 Tax=Corynebacterium sp. TaxID=1720 RepID=UPI002A91FDC8|nr:hypothetical protein [Corynebacterium sp.]MDY5785523.1 hypothetical protein [Corynebacterium sp.]